MCAADGEDDLKRSGFVGSLSSFSRNVWHAEARMLRHLLLTPKRLKMLFETPFRALENILSLEETQGRT